MYRRPSGKWVAQVDLGWIGGRRRRKSAFADTEREVLAKRDEVWRQLSQGVNLSGPPKTIADWMTEWLQVVKEGDGTSASTLAR